jgi:uncharacterized protein (TIGR00255 family)
MRSMTGFGQARGDNGRHEVAAVLRGVNHRFLDLSLRLREEYRESEAALRDLLAAELHRGRVEASFEVRSLEERSATVAVHRSVVRALHVAIDELIQEGLLGDKLSAGDLLALPAAFEIRLEGDAWAEDDQRLLLAVAGDALAQLIAARRLEGEKLTAILGEKLEALAEVTRALGALRVEALAEIQSGLARRLAELLADQPIDEQRLAQEAAILAERGDVAEELDRLAAHVEHFRAVCAEPGAIGKRLDFLTQEVFRELNTIGSKCRNAAMTRLVLDAKVLCEQLREQVQNVE